MSFIQQIGVANTAEPNIFAQTTFDGTRILTRKERKMKTLGSHVQDFARLNKDIILAIKEGGGIADPDTNARLRAVLQNCMLPICLQRQHRAGHQKGH